jgi:hypothetical protein
MAGYFRLDRPAINNRTNRRSRQAPVAPSVGRDYPILESGNSERVTACGWRQKPLVVRDQRAVGVAVGAKKSHSNVRLGTRVYEQKSVLAESLC